MPELSDRECFALQRCLAEHHLSMCPVAITIRKRALGVDARGRP